MQSVQLTFGRAFKVWWSYFWRAFVLTIPLSIITIPLFMAMVPHPQPGQSPAEVQAQMQANMQANMGHFGLLWLAFVVASVLVQVLAMRWMLQTKWSDFRLTATED